MRKWFILGSFAFTSILSQAQLEGKVLDRDTGKGIEYVNVYVRNQFVGTLTDSLGAFLIYLKAKSSNDTITFSRIGYIDKDVLIRAFDVSISLDPKTEIANTVILKGEAPRDTLLGFSKEELDVAKINGYMNMFSLENRNWFNNYGSEVAVKIEIPENISYAKSKRLGFYLPSVGSPRTPFRVKLYEVDPETGMPGAYIVEENLICRSKVKDDWFELELEDLNVYAKNLGLFISMEWLGNSERKYWSKKDLKKNKMISEEMKPFGKMHVFGQVLGMYSTSENTYYHRFSFKPWTKSIVQRQPMIRALFSIAE